jgi:ankyrin repeat protein
MGEITMNLQQTNLSSPIQRALFQAAKIGNINLVREFIALGANPFLPDADDRNALSYAIAANPEEASSLIMEMNKANDEAGEGSDE